MKSCSNLRLALLCEDLFDSRRCGEFKSPDFLDSTKVGQMFPLSM